MRQRNINSSYATSLLVSTAIATIIAVPAAAQEDYVCSAWNVDRGVEVITPTDGSAVCQVVYRKPDEGAADKVMWQSNSSVSFCNEKAQELTTRLTQAGFSCSEGRLPDEAPLIQATATTGSTTTQRADLQTLDATSAASENTSQNTSAGQQNMPMGGVPYQRIPGWADTSWHLAGYADATFIVTDSDGATTTDFSSARILPAFHFQYKDLVLLEAELEIEIDGDGETEVILEYAQADIFLHDSATLVFGQFLSPVGQFQERLHPTWINRLADPPPGFGHDGVQPTSDTGVMLRGGFLIGKEAMATYSIAVGNGPTVSHEGGVLFEAKGGDDNSNKAISGRFALLPLPYLEVGGSFLVGDVSGAEAEEPIPVVGEELLPTDAKLTLWGADAAYTRGPWSVRGEYLNATRDSINTAFEGSLGVETLPDLELEAWYAQIAYRLSGLTDHKILQRFEPVVRYGEFQVTGLDELAEEVAEERFDVGLNYWIAPSIVVRGVAQWRDFTAREEDEVTSETRFLLQLAYGF